MGGYRGLTSMVTERPVFGSRIVIAVILAVQPRCGLAFAFAGRGWIRSLPAHPHRSCRSRLYLWLLKDVRRLTLRSGPIEVMGVATLTYWVLPLFTGDAEHLAASKFSELSFSEGNQGNLGNQV